MALMPHGDSTVLPSTYAHVYIELGVSRIVLVEHLSILSAYSGGRIAVERTSKSSDRCLTGLFALVTESLRTVTLNNASSSRQRCTLLRSLEERITVPCILFVFRLALGICRR